MPSPRLLLRSYAARFIASGRDTRREHDAVRSFLTAARRAHFTDIADAGPMVVGDRNDLFCDAVLSFLQNQPAKN